MKTFNYYTPTHVFFGKDCELTIGEEIKALGKKSVLIVYGGGSVVKSGLLAKVEGKLSEAGVKFVSKGGVMPNPRLSFVEESIELAIENEVDFILAVGGGSCLDSAKATGDGLANPETHVWDFYTKKVPLTKSVDIGAVLTISAAGSEMSDSAVITNDYIWEKRGLSHNLHRPKIAFLNPEYTYTLPDFQVTCGVVDILMHTMERYFCTSLGNEITDQIAEGLMRVVIEKGAVAAKDKTDYDAMSEIMWCSSLSHNGLTGLGGNPDFATHQMGHEFSAKYDKAHGATLSSIWPSWARYVMAENYSRFARFGRNVWGITCGSDEEIAKMAIDKTEAFFASIDMPVTLDGMGIGVLSDEKVREHALGITFDDTRTIGTFKALNTEDIYNILTMANK